MKIVEIEFNAINKVMEDITADDNYFYGSEKDNDDDIEPLPSGGVEKEQTALPPIIQDVPDGRAAMPLRCLKK